jgi:hypothetical protein
VHGEQLVVLLRREHLHAGPGQFEAHQQRQNTTEQEKAKRADQVHPTDQFVVGGPQHLEQHRPAFGVVHRERRDRNGLWAQRQEVIRIFGDRPILGRRHACLQTLHALAKPRSSLATLIIISVPVLIKRLAAGSDRLCTGPLVASTCVGY